MIEEISFNSPIIEHPDGLKIILKEHQLAMTQKCMDIEAIDNNYGIMSDRPGSGKTYVILTLIYLKKIYNRANIIVVPQNIYTQWIMSIENFTNNITYKKFINYEDIISLYNDSEILKDNDFILTTSSYYHIIATTLTSLNIKIGRIFFDEIDSISNVIQTKIESDFIWFVSASFNKNLLGYYHEKLSDIDLNTITCKCNDDFINANILLEAPQKKYYLCTNIYIDNVLDKVLSKSELSGINALDYTLHNKIFHNKKAKDEKDIIELILSNRKSIIEFDTIKIKDSNTKIIFYEDIKSKSDEIISLFKENIKQLHKIGEFKNTLVEFIGNINTILIFFYDIPLEDKSLIDIIIQHRKNRIKTLMSIFENMLGLFYNMTNTNITETCNNYFEIRKRGAIIQNLQIQLKTMDTLNKTVSEIIDEIKPENDKSVNFSTEFNNFYDKFTEFKLIITNSDTSLTYYNELNLANNQIEIHRKNIDILEKRINDNKKKIEFIYIRLKDNQCCPICYEIFEDIKCDKVYITTDCCNNKICGNCIDAWYSIDKTTCIFCNTDAINKDNLFFYNLTDIQPKEENDIENNKIQTNKSGLLIDTDFIRENNIDFQKYNYNKNIFLEKYIKDLKVTNKKIIIFSGYSNIFQFIQDLCNDNNIGYVDLEKGNIKDIDSSVYEYKYGDSQVLLSNSTLFGCGMNFENADTIIFVHKMNPDLERQVIGRAQRMGRKTVLEVIYLEYNNESEFVINHTYNSQFDIDTSNDTSNDTYNDDILNDNELIGYYADKQYANILESIQTPEFNNIISGNEVIQDELSTIIEIPDLPSEPIDVNLDELIASLV
jgi:hypothetical protein